MNMNGQMKWVFLSVMAVASAGEHNFAADGVWTNAASGSWGATANWAEGVVPGVSETDAAAFNTVDLVSDLTVALDGDRTVNQLVFGDTDTTSAAGWIVESGSAGALTLAGLSPTVAVNALGTNKAAAIRAVIRGTNGLVKAGVGALALSATNTYGGATAIIGGRLVLSDTTFPSNHQVSIASGTVLEYAATQMKRQQMIDISGPGTLVKTGAGTLSFGENQGNAINWKLDHGAWIDVQGGTLVGGSWHNDNWSANLASLNIATGAVFRGDEANVRVSKMTGGGTVQTGYNSGSYTGFTIGLEDESCTFAGCVANDESVGNVIKTGTGILTFSGTNTYTGNTGVNGGTLKVSGRLYYNGANSNAAVSVKNGGVLELDTWGCGKDASLGLLDGAAARLAVDGGTLRVIGATASGRGVTVNAGGATLEVARDARWSISDAGTPWIYNGTPSLTLTGEGSGFFGKTVAGLGSLVKTGSGKWTLAGTNTLDAAVSIVSGTLQVTVTLPTNNAPVSGAALWLDATQGVTLNTNGNVTVWADRSGNGHNATNGASAGPTLTADINGLPTLRFTRSQSQYLCEDGLGSVSNLTIFIVRKLVSVNSLQTFIGTDGNWTGDDSAGGAGRTVHLITAWPPSTLNYAVYPSDGYGLTPQSAGTAQVDVVVDNSGPYQLFLNDQANGSSAARITVKKNLNAFRIGSWNNDRYLDASIGELLIYTNALSAAERQSTYEYLKGKWLNADRFGVLQCLTSNQLSATATVTVGTNAVLDLGGQSQTLAGIAGGGIVTNGSLAVAGIVEPGGAGTVGTLTFASAVTLSGVLSVDVSACSCDRVEVKGTLDLSTLAIRIENPAQLDRTQVYTLISCTGELTGDFLPTSVLSGAWFVRYDRQAGKALLVYRGGTLIKVL